ncbi:oxidoreductase [Phlyctema vagabunda]|uniref:Oxidoreductase n=1 Tax=Phlyctema vagabunda TaxID=108571 RepID=A0ABR4P851_9HELO
MSSDSDQSDSNVESLDSSSHEEVLEDLRATLDGYEATANYACGGQIAILAGPPVHEYGSDKSAITTHAVTVRFDTSDNRQSKIQFPVLSEDDAQELLKACAPATFGLNGEDVLDETYRKAGKLDRSQFCVDWHPTDCGIVDAIKQALLPEIRKPDLKGCNTSEEHWGVVAELYKLNIYSGPHGKFRKHVDTPRGLTQFGSLVVCLPMSHSGGELRVCHRGHEMFFDWSGKDTSSIKWAAFYSDCEHEVLRVNTGHRVTLTYNLYVSEQVGGLLQRFPTADPSLYPLYAKVKNLLKDESFESGGATMAFFCAHQYAHTRSQSIELLPFALKGIDVAVFSVFKALGLMPSIRPILDNDNFRDHDKECLGCHDHVGKVESVFSKRLEYEYVSRVGDDLEEIQMANSEMEEGGCMESYVERAWPLETWNGIIWLNSPSRNGNEIAMVGMVHGNQAELVWHYSHAAIMIDIPAANKRRIVDSV